MAITWGCKQFGIDCDHETSGETVEEVRQRWSEHAHAVHPLDEMPAYLRDRVRAAMPEEN